MQVGPGFAYEPELSGPDPRRHKAVEQRIKNSAAKTFRGSNIVSVTDRVVPLLPPDAVDLDRLRCLAKLSRQQLEEAVLAKVRSVLLVH